MKEANTSTRCQPKVRVSEAGIGGQLDGRQRKAEGEKVEEYMGGIGKKRQRIGPDSAGYLGQQSQGGQ